jgi:5'-nucleotidase
LKVSVLPEILITNDDGIHSPGIQALAEAVAGLGRVTLVAPDRERSAASQSLTIQRPLRYEEIAPGRFAVDGTPADCVLIALHHILPVLPDLVISGINRGANLGHDVGYSGTVAAALEAAHNKVPAFAISLATWDSFDFSGASRVGAQVARQLLEKPIPVSTILNVNVPPGKWLGYRITRQGIQNTESMIVENEDPRGRKFFWFDQKYAPPHGEAQEDIDWQAVRSGHVSITPLKIERTDFELFDHLRSWPSKMFGN